MKIIAEVLIIGPIPPFLKESHLAANPEAIVHQEDQGDEDEDHTEEKNVESP